MGVIVSISLANLLAAGLYFEPVVYRAATEKLCSSVDFPSVR